MTFDNNTIWNRASRAGLLLGAVSVACLVLKELAGLTGNSFIITAASIILWALEFFGCIWLMKEVMLRFRDAYDGVKMEDTYRLGRRAALLSGLILASAEALLIMKMPEADLNSMADQLIGGMQLSSADKDNLEGMLSKLPLFTFIFQWLYCYLYGSVLASILSRYIFLQKLFGGFPPKDTPDQQ